MFIIKENKRIVSNTDNISDAKLLVRLLAQSRANNTGLEIDQVGDTYIVGSTTYFYVYQD